MSPGQPPPPGPDGPRGFGDPTSISTWVAVGGAIILVVAVVAVTQLNRFSRKPDQATPPPVPTPSAAEALTGTYRIIFDGSGSGHFDEPNNRQTFRSRDAKADWHLEYTYGTGHGDEPDLATSRVTGSGESKVWDGNGGCVATAVTYTPRVSMIRRDNAGNLSLAPPLAGDLLSPDCDSAKGKVDPFFTVWNAACPPPPDECGAKLVDFEKVPLKIEPGQTGTVVTTIPNRSFEHTNMLVAGAATGARSEHSWSGKITVIAQ
jgi:hypothetical protein